MAGLQIVVDRIQVLFHVQENEQHDQDHGGDDLIAQEDKTATTKDKLQNLKRTGRNNEIIIAPGASAAVMTPAQQRKALRAAKKAAEEAQKQRRFSFSLDNKKQENTGETKFTTNYIIDNVIHTTLQVERK